MKILDYLFYHTLEWYKRRKSYLSGVDPSICACGMFGLSAMAWYFFITDWHAFYTGQRQLSSVSHFVIGLIIYALFHFTIQQAYVANGRSLELEDDHDERTAKETNSGILLSMLFFSIPFIAWAVVVFVHALHPVAV